MKKQIDYKRILLHILFWILVLVSNSILYGYEKGDYGKVLLSMLPTLPFDILATYITLYIFVPKFLLKKKYLEFSIYFIASAIVIIMIEWIINQYFVYVKIYDLTQKEMSFWSIYILFLGINIYKFVTLALAIKLVRIWYKNDHLQNKLQSQNLKSEIALLKNQINPHFLFNTLNNIDALIYQDTEKASDAVIKLSEIMRYMLYETNESKVLLEKEIDYIKNYISILLLRVKSPEFIKLEINGNCIGKKIAPMLLVPFIENAFKHGDKKIVKKGIIIRIDIKNNRLTFAVENYLKQSSTDEDKTGGIGLNNVRRRLEIIYGENATLKTYTKNNKFVIKLTIKQL